MLAISEMQFYDWSVQQEAARLGGLFCLSETGYSLFLTYFKQRLI